MPIKINSLSDLSTEVNVKEKLCLSFKTCTMPNINHTTRTNALVFRYLYIHTCTTQWRMCAHLSKIHYK